LNEKVILVVPCFNEEDRLDPESFIESLEKDSRLHWIFVDDGSKDRTAAVIQSMVDQHPDRIFIHQLKNNSGKGEAVRQGLLRAVELEATLTGYYDADQATPLSELFRLLSIFKEQNVQVLFGARVFLLGRNINRQRWRFWLGRCFALVASQMLRLRVYDTQCGMKLIRHFPKLKSCIEKPFASSWLFDVELIQRLLKEGGLKVDDFYEEPLLAWTDVGGSKVKARAFAVALYDLFKIKLRSLRG
jgi:dolichyl-phosphate beta-glucosyltransferase